MQTMKREINSFVSRKSFKYNDVIDSKIVNLNIWCYFWFFNKLSWKLKSDINSRSISDWVRMLKLSIWVESENWYQVLKLSQKIDIETQLNDQFTSESLTTKCVLSNNEINYSLKSLIDIEAADYSFINEVIAQIVYNQLQIKSLTLIKAKSIWEFNNHYAKKLITHVIYSNLTVHDYMIDTAFMLITWLNQHQMILEKTWINKINLVINMQINFLRFSNFNSTSQRSIILLSSNKLTMKQKSLTSTRILKRFFTFVTSQFSQKSLSFSQKKSFIEQLKQHDVTLTNVKISKSTSNSLNIVMIKVTTYRMLVKQSDVKIFAVIILKIDQLITTVENKSKEVNLHKFSHIKILKKIKVKLFLKYHDYLDMFNWVMMN